MLKIRYMYLSWDPDDIVTISMQVYLHVVYSAVGIVGYSGFVYIDHDAWLAPSYDSKDASGKLLEMNIVNINKYRK